MSKYIHNPEVVEAIQWFPGIQHFRIDAEDSVKYKSKCIQCGYSGEHAIVRDDEHGILPICPSDWIVTDPSGEVFVITDKKFKEKYVEAGGK